MARHYIGATTLTDGKATFPYLCKGGGELEIKASVREGSETLFEDKGTSASHNDNWSYESNLTRSRSSTETTLTQTDTSSQAVCRIDNLGGNYCFEFDLKCIYSSDFQIISFRYDSSSKKILYPSNLDLSDGKYHHIKLVVNGLSLSIYVDGVEKTPTTLSDNYNRFYLQVNGGATVNYKNFIIYSLGTGEETISTPTPLIDAKYMQECDKIYKPSSAGITPNQDGSCTLYVNTGTYAFHYLSLTSSSSSRVRLTSGNVVEFDVLEYTGSILLRLDGSNGNEELHTINEIGHYKIEYNGTQTIITVNGVQTQKTTIDDSKLFAFRPSTASSSIKVKNWLYY